MKKKVIFMIPTLAGGGAERVFVNIVNGIDKTVFDVTLVYLSDERNVYEVSNNVHVVNLKVKRVRNAPLKIIKLIQKEKPDLIVSTLGHLNTMLMMLKIFFPMKTRLIIRQTNIMSFNRSKNKANDLIQKGLMKFYKNADKVICQSELMKNDFIEITGIRENNVVKIFNLVDVNSALVKAKEDVKHNFNENQINIFFVGRLEEVKRIPLIIDAFKQFHEKNSRSRLYILGEGPKEKVLKDYIEKHKLSKYVELLGFQRNPYKWIKHADLFIMASKHEGMPNVLIEALALEIPVLILKHPGGTIDILKSLDIEDRFVDKLVINEDSFNKYDDRILSRLIANFGVDYVIKQYESLFLSVIKEEH